MKIGIITYKSNSSNILFKDIIHRYNEEIDYIAVCKQSTNYTLIKTMDRKFLLYKIIERFCENKIKSLAKKYNIPYFTDLDNITETDLILCYSSPILRKEVIDSAKLGCLNCHASMLPEYKGAAQYYWYLAHKKKKGGVTIHFMTEKIDEGDIILQEEFDIDNDTMYSLHNKIAETGLSLFIDVIEMFRNGKVNRIKQGKGSYFPIPQKVKI